MINVNIIYNAVKQALGRYQKTNITPIQFNESLNLAEVALMNELVGNNTNNPNISRQRQFFLGVSDSSNEQLKPFIKEESFVGVTTGFVSINSLKAFHVENVTVNYTGSNIYAHYRSVDRFNAEVSSEIDKPSVSYPIWTIKDSGIAYAPISGTSIVGMTYVAHPHWDFGTSAVKKTEWKYTGTGADITYDPSTSVHSRFLDSSFDGLLSHILKYLGYSLKDNTVVGLSNQLKNEV